jgi:hypothetical protein
MFIFCFFDNPAMFINPSIRNQEGSIGKSEAKASPKQRHKNCLQPNSLDQRGRVQAS